MRPVLALPSLAVHSSHPMRVLLQEALNMLAEAVYQCQWRHLHEYEHIRARS